MEEDRTWLRAERARLQRQEADLHAEHERIGSELDTAIAAHRQLSERLHTHRIEVEDFHRKLDDFHKNYGTLD